MSRHTLHYIGAHAQTWDRPCATDGRAWEARVTERGLQSAPPDIQAEFREVVKARRVGFAAVFRELGDASDVPIVVLLAGQKPALPPGEVFPGDFDKYAEAVNAQRMEHFGNMTRRAKNGLLLLVGPAGHFVQSTEPDTVAWAIRRVLNLATVPSAST